MKTLKYIFWSFFFVICSMTWSFPLITWSQEALSAAGKSVADKNRQPLLRRVDFRLAGTSCAACVKKAGKLLREQPGVLKIDISLLEPHNGVLIYDKNVTDLEALSHALSLAPEKVKMIDIAESVLDKLPFVLLPRVSKSKS